MLRQHSQQNPFGDLLQRRITALLGCRLPPLLQTNALLPGNYDRYLLRLRKCHLLPNGPVMRNQRDMLYSLWLPHRQYLCRIKDQPQQDGDRTHGHSSRHLSYRSLPKDSNCRRCPNTKQ
jgi:hypothetical protein